MKHRNSKTQHIDSSTIMCTKLLSAFFFFNDTATTEIYTLSLHDALPISNGPPEGQRPLHHDPQSARAQPEGHGGEDPARDVHLRHRGVGVNRSEEHTSELQSRLHLVCRLLLEKKKKKQ